MKTKKKKEDKGFFVEAAVLLSMFVGSFCLASWAYLIGAIPVY